MFLGFMSEITKEKECKHIANDIRRLFLILPIIIALFSLSYVFSSL